MTVQLRPKFVDDGNSVRQRSARLGHELFCNTGRLQVGLKRCGARLEALGDRPQPPTGARDRCRRGVGRSAELAGTHGQRVSGRDRRRRELGRGVGCGAGPVCVGVVPGAVSGS